MWKILDKTQPDSAHYSIMDLMHRGTAVDALRVMFPDAKANEMNFVFFSTSGVHGTYNTIEEAEKAVLDPEAKDEYGDPLCDDVTFVVVHPRLVVMRYGNCQPKNQDDIDFLKALRKSSWKVAANIGKPN